MELNQPVMTSTPLAYRGRKKNNIEVSPIFPITKRKIKSLVPSFTCIPQPVGRGRRKTDSEFKSTGFDKGSKITSEAKPLEILKKSLMMKLRDLNAAKSSEENIIQGKNVRKEKSETASLKKRKALSAYQENVQLPGKRDTTDKRSSNINIIKSTEKSKSSVLDLCAPQETKKGCLSKRKSIHQNVGKSVLPNSKQNLEENYNQNLTEQGNDDQKYSSENKQNMLKSENPNKIPHTATVKETIPKSPFTNKTCQTYVLTPPDEHVSLDKLSSNKRKNKQTLTNIHPKKKKKGDDGELVIEQAKLPINARTEETKADEGKEYDEMSAKCGESVSCAKSGRRISKKPRKTKESIKPRATEQKCIEGIRDIPDKNTSNINNLKSTNQSKRSNFKNDIPKETKKVCLSKREIIHQLKIQSDSKQDMEENYNENLTEQDNDEMSPLDISYPPNKKQKVLKNDKTPHSTVKETIPKSPFTRTSQTYVLIQQDEHAIGNKLSSDNGNNIQILTNKYSEIMNKEDDGLIVVKQAKLPKNAKTKQTKTDEGKEHGEKCESVSCTKTRRRISKKTIKTQESLTLETNKKKTTEINSDIQFKKSKILKDAKITQIKNCIDIENKETVFYPNNKLIPVVNCPVPCKIATDKPLEEGNDNKSQDTQSIELKSGKIPVKAGMRKISNTGTDVTRARQKKARGVSFESRKTCEEEKEIYSQEYVFKEKIMKIRRECDDNLIPEEPHLKELAESGSQVAEPTREDSLINDAKQCFPMKNIKLMIKEGAVMHTFIHISNYVMTGSFLVEPGGAITKASTSTTFFVVHGVAKVRIGSVTKTIRSQDAGSSFFIRKCCDFSITNEEEMYLKLLFTKFAD